MSEVDFSKRASSIFLRYGLAVLLVGIALLLTRLLGHAMAATPTTLFFAAVIITAWHGGIGPGLLAIALSAIAIDTFLVTHDQSLTISLTYLPRLITFVLSALLISSLSAARKRAEAALIQERDKLEITVKERTSELAKANDSLQAEITERKLAEQGRERLLEDLKTERALLETVLRQMPAGVVIAEAPSGKVVLGNKQVEQILRHSFSLVEEIEQYEAYACYSADGRAYRPEEMPLARSTLTGEVVNGEEIHFVRGDGVTGKVLLSSCPVRDSEGNIVAGVAVFHDITEQKRAEEALRESEERYRELFENANDVVYTLDMLGNLTSLNKACERLTGYTREELLGKPLAQFVTPAHLEMMVGMMQRKLEGDVLTNYEVEIMAKGGRKLVLEVSSRLVYHQGEAMGVQGIARDITERKSAEEAIRHSEERFSKAFNASPHPMSITSLDEGRYVDVNDALLRDVGYSREEIIGRTITDLDVYVDAADRARMIRSLEEHGNIRDMEIKFRARGGATLLFSLSADIISLNGQKCLLTASHNVTERKRAEEAIRLSERQYRTLADAVPQLVWMNNAEGMKKYFNGRWQEYTGTLPEEQMDMNWLSVIHPDDLQTVVGTRTKGVESGEAYEFECRMRRADGAYRWHLARVVPLKDDGKTLQWFGTATDIHDIKRAEESNRFLAEAGALLASSLEEEVTIRSMARIAVPYLADWCIVDLLKEDGSVERIAGHHSDPSKEKWLAELIKHYPQNYQGDTGCSVPEVLRTGKPEIKNEIAEEWLAAVAHNSEHCRILRELGLGSYLVVPLVTRGRTLGAVSFSSATANRYGASDLDLAQDLAYRAALAIENARLYHEAHEANRVKDEFLATVSHELRTPLNAILGWAEILRAGKLEESAKERAIDTIVRNGKSQAQLIEDILDVSRIITGKLRLDFRPVGLVSIINAAVDAVRPAAFAKDIDIQVLLDATAGSISGDPNRLQQVIWNLVSNAIKFTPQKGVVVVKLERSDSHAQIVVGDSGVGIKAEFLPHVFDRFRQADSSYTRSHGGLGLGLAIVRHFVEMHGGTVHAESDGEGKGATFTVRLPLRESRVADIGLANQAVSNEHSSGVQPARPASVFPGPQPAILSGLWLLVVDDEHDARELISTVLKQSGATVAVVASAAEALDVLAGCEHGRQPDVILSDIGMPDEDGLSLIERVRAMGQEAGANIPAIALTAYARAEDRERVLRAGYQLHISKPFEPMHLVTAVASLARQTRRGFGN